TDTYIHSSVVEQIKKKTAVSAIPVAACGRMIFQNAARREYPSTSAASSYARGISSINPFINHTASERLNAVYRMINPRCEFWRFSSRYIRKIGMTTASGGM